ncbi:MAG TPA: hypothetical protein VM578_12570 [Candidatus Saccharimonadales bacterium]|nr:hypothetical protein [Candidatus Saccharimonadales bacterium]
MSKLRIEHGASKITWVQLKTNIEESIATEIDLLCEWSENDRRYIINELLRFGLTQDEDFQKYKAEQQAKASTKNASSKPASPQVKPSSDIATNPAVRP